MSVAADRCNTWASVVIERQLVTGLLHESDQETSQASVNVKRDVVFERDLGQVLNGINHTDWEVGRRASDLESKVQFQVENH